VFLCFCIDEKGTSYHIHIGGNNNQIHITYSSPASEPANRLLKNAYFESVSHEAASIDDGYMVIVDKPDDKNTSHDAGLKQFNGTREVRRVSGGSEVWV